MAKALNDQILLIHSLRKQYESRTNASLVEDVDNAGRYACQGQGCIGNMGLLLNFAVDLNFSKKRKSIFKIIEKNLQKQT